MVYASRDLFHKKPFGAVAAGEGVTFTLTPPRAAAWWRVFLCISAEFSKLGCEFEMDWRGFSGEDEVYSFELDTSELLGPVWYWFRCERLDGRVGFYDNPANLEGGACAYNEGYPRSYQLTVTHAEPNPVPKWYGRGVTYHIFPDRFCRGDTTEAPPLETMPGERWVHEDWYECPAFLPDEKGEVRNRDFFGGNIAGVREKLPYIASLGAGTIYFSPIFEAASNHRYDTASYGRVDPLFGTEAEFSALCKEASALGMRVILDGVFNHTGFDSEYFNGKGFYPGLGAYQSKDSPYYDWFSWQEWPHKYESWWGIYTLPQVNESHPGYLDYIVRGKDSVVRRWLRAGASGWRLDVADELPDAFIEELCGAVREEMADAVVIGEVWEDASNKISYSERRKYLLGKELDGVMNYPFRDSLLNFILGGNARDFRVSMETLREHYPRDIYHCLMNALGTHDTPRILTVLGASPDEWGGSKERRADAFLPTERRVLAIKRLKLATAVLFTFPGSPCVYYGDEAGLEGFEDPFNRRCYPWGREDTELLDWYRLLGKTRNDYEVLQSGSIKYLRAEDGLLVYERFSTDGDKVLVCLNRGDFSCTVTAEGFRETLHDIFTGDKLEPQDGMVTVCVEPMSVKVLV